MTIKETYSLISIYDKVSEIFILIISETNSKNLIIKDMFEAIDIDFDIKKFRFYSKNLLKFNKKNSLSIIDIIAIIITNNEIDSISRKLLDLLYIH